MKNFNILTNKYSVIYVIIINLLPFLFYKIFNWNISEYFLYFLTESAIISIFLFIKSIFYNNRGKVFLQIYLE